MSNIDKQALRKRYYAKPTPKCDICGAKMTIQRMSGSRVTYGCSGAIYDETGCHYAEGRSLADDHYEQSRVTVTDESDPDVLALLDEISALEQGHCGSALLEREEMHAKTLGRMLDEMDAKDRRIAELEAREVVLPSTQDVHPLGPQSAKIFCEFHRSIVNRCADEIRKVGVKVSIKGN